MVPKTGTISGLDDDFDLGTTKRASKMDDLDDIPLKVKKKKERPKKFIDDIDSFSDSDSESDQEESPMSDKESMSSELSSSRSNLGHSHGLASRTGESVTMTMSRSSSKSDVSEKSDLSDLAKRAANASPSVARERGYGPIGSPSVDAYGLAPPPPLKVPTALSSRPIGTSAAEEARLQMHRVDMEFVTSIANEVVERLYQGKNVSQEEKSITFEQVSKQIWSDFQRSGSSPAIDNSALTLPQSKPTKLPSSGVDLSAIDQGRNKINYADQYMKTFYQKNLPDPYTKRPPNSNSNISGSSFLTTNPSSTFSFPSIHSTEPPPPLSIPTSAMTDTGKFPSIHSDTSLSFPSSGSGNIWSTNDASSIPSALNLGNPYAPPQAPPPLKLPEKANPFNNLSIGTSIAKNDISAPMTGYSSALLRKHQGMQTELRTMEKDTMTDPYEPNKEEMMRLQEQLKFKDSQLRWAQNQIVELSEIVTARDKRNQVI